MPFSLNSRPTAAAECADAWTRYVYPLQRYNPHNSAPNSGFLSATSSDDVADEKRQEHAEVRHCSVVADEKGGLGVDAHYEHEERLGLQDASSS